jgi:integrase
MLEEAEGWGIGVNVAKRIRAPRPGRPELRIPTAEETRLILETVAGSNIEGPTLLAAGCGLRLGESLALRRTDVNTDKAELRVTATMYRGGRTAPKSPRSRRKVAMPGFVATWLKGHLAEQAARQIASVAWSDGSYVFDRGAGVPMVVETVSHQFARLVAEVGLGDVRMHDLRHAFATRLFERGVHPKVVSEALGHASIAITLDTYSHVMPSMGRIAADAIEAVLRDGRMRGGGNLAATERPRPIGRGRFRR